jgi:hypothetical protein
MISTTIASDLYSLNGGTPVSLPNRIRLSNGLTKTDITTFTAEELTFAGFEGPFNLEEYNPEQYVPEWNSETKSWVMTDHPQWVADNYTPTVEEETAYIREKRNYILGQSDWTRLDDNGLSDDKKAEWATYRQTLRDIPQQSDFDGRETSVTWPTKPE